MTLREAYTRGEIINGLHLEIEPHETTTNRAPVIETVDESVLKDLREALRYLDADGYKRWIDTGLALKTLGEQGRPLWHEFSKQSSKYNYVEAEKKWESFEPVNSNYKAVFTAAQSNGWKNPGYLPDVPLVDGLEDFINRNDPRVKANQLPNISRYRLLGNADFENMTQVEWRIKKIFPLQGMAAIYGPSGAGKTFLANDAACAIAEGRNWFGYRVKAAPVLYVVLEGEAVFQNRIQAWKRHNDRPLPGNLRVIMQPFCLTNPANLNDLAAIAPKGCVMFIDTMNRSVPTADENSSKDMGEIIKGAKDLERLTNGLIVLIAHPGKDPTKGLRGHSSLIAALDSVICVTRENDLRRWIVEKSKDDIDGSKHTFQLQTINLGIDEDGEVITSCVIVPSSYVESPDRDKPLTPNKQLGWNSFIEASKDNECFDKSGNFKGVHLDKWRNEFYRVCPADNQDAKKKAFQRARKDLLELKRLTVSNDVYRFDSLYAINEGWIKKSLKTQAGH